MKYDIINNKIITAQQFLDSFKEEINWVEVRNFDDEKWFKHVLLHDLGDRFSDRFVCVRKSDEAAYLRGDNMNKPDLWRQMRPIPSIDYSQFKENDIVEVNIKNAVRIGYFNKTDSKYLYLKYDKNNVNSKAFSLSEIKNVTKIK